MKHPGQPCFIPWRSQGPTGNGRNRKSGHDRKPIVATFQRLDTEPKAPVGAKAARSGRVWSPGLNNSVRVQAYVMRASPARGGQVGHPTKMCDHESYGVCSHSTCLDVPFSSRASRFKRPPFDGNPVDRDRYALIRGHRSSFLDSDRGRVGVCRQRL